MPVALCIFLYFIFSPQSYNFFCNNPNKPSKFSNLDFLFSSRSFFYFFPPLLLSIPSLLLFLYFLPSTCSFFSLIYIPACSFFSKVHPLACSFFLSKHPTMHKKRSKLKPTPFISHQTIFVNIYSFKNNHFFLQSCPCLVISLVVF